MCALNDGNWRTDFERPARETEPKNDTGPSAAVGRKRGRRRGRKLSPERMQIVLDSLREYPVLYHAARRAGIHPKALAYWIKRSAAGDAGYDVEWQAEVWRFHEHCESAIEEADDRLPESAWVMAMGGVVYKIDPTLVALGCEGPDAYLTDKNGNPIPEVVYKPSGKMVRSLLEWKYPERWGKYRKPDVPHNTGVVVVGGLRKEPKNRPVASIRARRWKAFAKKINEAKSQ